MLIEFDWLSQPGVQNTLNFVYKIIDIVRIIVPIALVVMTTMDVTKKVINPEDKEGQKKILIRAIAAIVVFFVPTLINFVFKLADIDPNKTELERGSSTPTPFITPRPTTVPTIIPTPIPTLTPTPKPTNTPKPTLSKLSITNCPGVAKVQKTGDKFILTTDISSDYDGEITWSSSKSIVKITPDNNNRKAKLEILTSPSDEVVDITVSSGGKMSICSIYVQRTKQLSSLSITNCPSLSKTYQKHDKISLETDIPANYNGEIEWSHNKNIVKITPGKDKRNATIEILDSNLSGETVDITVTADGLYKICSLYVKDSFSNIKITNCPTNQTFKNGDTIRLYTNVPSDYNGEVVWNMGSSSSGGGIAPNAYEVVEESNNEYAIHFKNITTRTHFDVIALLPSENEKNTCGFTVLP